MPSLSIRPLYRVALTKPLSPLSTPPSLLSFPPVAYAPRDDLLAVISGDGSVSVAHLDSPGESTTLVSWRRSPARHIAWRPHTDTTPLLLVVDAAGRLAFWAASDRRVNVWAPAALVDAGGLLAGVAWTKDGGAVVGVLSSGEIVAWAVPEVVGGAAAATPRGAAVVVKGGRGRALGGVVPLRIRKGDAKTLLGGPVRIAGVSAGGLEDGSVAVVSVGAGSAGEIKVWHVVVVRRGGEGVGFDVKGLGSARVGEADGKVEGVIAAPWKGCLFVAGAKGVLSRWFYDMRKGGVWVRQCGGGVEGLWRLDEERGSLVDGRRACDGEVWNIGERGRRKCYGMSVVQGGSLVVTSDAGGWTVWDSRGSGLEVVARRTLEAAEGEGMGKHFWGVSLSRNGAVVAALDGKGCVEVSALVPGEGVSEDVQKVYVESVARGLVNSTSGNGLRGGWDLRAALSVEPGDRATAVFKAMDTFTGSGGGGGVSQEKIENLRFVVRSSVDAYSGSMFAARRLLDASVKAIMASAPEVVTSRMSPGAWRDPRQLANLTELLKIVRQTVASSSAAGAQPLYSTHFSAVPLADWIILLCVVWLRRYAKLLLRGAPARSVVGSVWSDVVAMDATENDASDTASVVRDRTLTQELRLASVAACLLLALNDSHGDGSTEARYMRLSREQCADVVSAMWDVSLVVQEASGGIAGAPAGASPQEKQKQHSRNKMTALAKVLSRHTLAAEVLKGSNGLKIEAAERALGMRGAAVGAGFIMSRARERSKDRSEAVAKFAAVASRSPGMNKTGVPGKLPGSEVSGAEVVDDKATRSTATTAQTLGTTVTELESSLEGVGTTGTELESSLEGVRKTWLVESSRDLENEAKASLPTSVRSTDWCPYDVVTGRALPSWVPLRRCVLSGLLAAETTQPMPDGRPGQNSVMPWAARWALESPLGGCWARVPSLDLDRFELLPAVSVATGNGAVRAHQHRASASYVSGATPPHGLPAAGAGNTSGYPTVPQGINGHYAASGQVSAGAPLPGATGSLCQGFTPSGAQQQSGMPNATGPGYSPGPVQVPSNGTPSVGSQGAGVPSGPPSVSGPSVGGPRPNMSTASSTSVLDSTSSKGRKRGPASGRRGGRKKQNMEPRTPTPSQMSGLGVNGGVDSMAGGAGGPISGKGSGVSGPSGVATPGGGGTVSVGPTGSIGPTGSVGPTGIGGAPSALSGVRSSDTRSTRTAATHTSGGVDQVVRKGKPRVRRQTKAQAAAVKAEHARQQQAVQHSAQQQMMHQSQMHLQQQHGRPTPNVPQGMVTSKQMQMLGQGPAQQASFQLQQHQKSMGMLGSQFPHQSQGNGHGMASYDQTQLQASTSGAGLGSRTGNGSGHLNSKPGDDVNGMLGLDILQGVHSGMRSPTASATSGQRRNSGQLMGGGMGPGNPTGSLSGPDGSGMLMQSPSQSDLGMPPGGQKQQGSVGVSFGQPMQSGVGGRNMMSVNSALSDLQAQLGMSQMSQPPMDAFARQNALQHPVASQMRSSSPQGTMDNQSVTSGQQARPALQNKQNVHNAQRHAQARQQQQQQQQQLQDKKNAQLAQQSLKPRRGQYQQVNLAGRGNMSQGAAGSMLDTESQTTVGSGAGGRGLGPSGSSPGQRNSGSHGFNGGGGSQTGGDPPISAPSTAVTGAGAPRGMSAGASGSRAETVWRGQLRIKGKTTNFGFACEAVRIFLSDKPPIQNADCWPSPLVCDASKLKEYNEVLPFISASNTQWYVRFMPQTGNRGEQETSQSDDFISAMVSKRLAFEIYCNEPDGPTGSLYIWAIQLPNAGPSLLGVFRPTTPSAAPSGILF